MKIRCEECEGTGLCSTCGGGGVVIVRTTWVDCPDCQGTGECNGCDGTGEINV